MKEIPLNHNKVALVDDDDFEYLNQWTWFYATYKNNRDGYAERANSIGAKPSRIKMHRVISRAKKGETVDHRDNNSLNNCKSNLRLCTVAQNCQNKRKQLKATTSIYKGVHFHKPTRKWRARISLPNDTRKSLGLFPTQKLAARAYDDAAQIYFGEFANLNFKIGDPETEKIIGNIHEFSGAKSNA